MKFPNNNQPIIRKLTRRTLKFNRTRNIMAILAIALTSILFTSLFTISMGIVESMQQETMRQAGGSAHGSFKYLTDEEFKNLKGHPLIKDIEYSIMLSMGENEELLKHHTEIRYATDGQARMWFSYPTTGRMPQKSNELATDTEVLDLLGVPHQIGQRVTIDYSLNDKKFSREFVLCGFWESDSVACASMVHVSELFIKNALAGIDQELQEHDTGTGLIFADVMFKNALNIENNMKTIITDSGYSLDQNSKSYINYGVNWAYLSTNFDIDLTTIIAILGALALIIFTGYLIIFNIFHISVIKDVRFYGLLKTIGTTPQQIKKIIQQQAFLLSAIGIPVGLIMGYILGAVLLPIIMSISNVANSTVSFSPLIFVGAAVFSLLTVFISCRKPGLIAASVSPVEAVRYTGQTTGNQKLIKKSFNGGKIYKMAWANLARNQKKTVIVVISMSLSLILLNSVFTITKGFDMNKFVRNFFTTDFVIGHANYFNSNFRFEDDELSPRMITAVNSQEGLEGYGRVYYDIKSSHITHDNTKMNLQLYGVESFPLSQLNIVKGTLDADKLKTGYYIIEGVFPDDNGNIRWKTSPFEVGDKVTLKYADSISKEYEVLAIALVENGMDVRYSWEDGVIMYLPAGEFASQIKNPVTMSYVFNVDDQHTPAMDKFLKNYTQTVETAMDYESKQLFVDQFKSLQKIFLTVGGTLSFIIGIIGLLNFINSILTSIIARRREFAMLQSLGMTDRQLCSLLMFEGLYYALATIAITLLLGTVFSLVAIQALASNLWFFSYKFVILPLLIAAPLLVLISIVIPLVSYKSTNTQTIVERLRESE